MAKDNGKHWSAFRAALDGEAERVKSAMRAIGYEVDEIFIGNITEKDLHMHMRITVSFQASPAAGCYDLSNKKKSRRD